jgi:hypothetical protein
MVGPGQLTAPGTATTTTTLLRLLLLVRSLVTSQHTHVFHAAGECGNHRHWHTLVPGSKQPSVGGEPGRTLSHRGPLLLLLPGCHTHPTLRC